MNWEGSEKNTGKNFDILEQFIEFWVIHLFQAGAIFQEMTSHSHDPAQRRGWTNDR